MSFPPSQDVKGVAECEQLHHTNGIVEQRRVVRAAAIPGLGPKKRQWWRSIAPGAQQGDKSLLRKLMQLTDSVIANRGFETAAPTVLEDPESQVAHAPRPAAFR
ncbi:MAG: hypothetical protein WA510_12460 [Acidobacteriaceae bacterium]